MTTTDRLVDALVGAVGDPGRVVTGTSVLDLHAADLTCHPPRRPDVVVYPVSTAEVAAVLQVASSARAPVTPFGAGSSLEGHVIPIAGGISLDLTRMDRILSVSPEDLTATVQPGVTRSALERAAAAHGLFFPVDPGADATIGGMTATNAAGTTTVRYGKMRANVLALEAVLADGTVIHAGTRARKTSAGYDLLGLLVGSEGTLAVITAVTVKLHGIPEHAVVARLAFADLESACRAASAIVGAGSGVSRVEFVDEWTIAAVNAYSGTRLPERPTLFVEAAGSEGAVEAELELVEELAKDAGVVEIVRERDPTARARLWKARHDSAYATQAMAPGTKQRSTDTCVPIGELAAAAAFAREAVERSGLFGGILGHAGDGNLHVALQLNPDDPEQLRRADEIVEALIEDALARGGTCTGEHGIGLGKIGALEREHGDLLPLMRGIKELFDPLGILNPGKVLRPRI